MPDEVIELLRIQANSLGWAIYSPDLNNFDEVLLSKSPLLIQYVRDNNKATLWPKVGKITLLRSGSPEFNDFLELDEWLTKHPESTKDSTDNITAPLVPVESSPRCIK